MSINITWIPESSPENPKVIGQSPNQIVLDKSGTFPVDEVKITKNLEEIKGLVQSGEMIFSDQVKRTDKDLAELRQKLDARKRVEKIIADAQSKADKQVASAKEKAQADMESELTKAGKESEELNAPDSTTAGSDGKATKETGTDKNKKDK
jgi:hypothetical protein